MLDKVRAALASIVSHLKTYVDHPLMSEHRGFLTLLSLNVAVFIAQCLVPTLTVILCLKSTDWPSMLGVGEIFTSMFAHGNFSHIFYNMLIVAPFAIYLERRIGSTRFMLLWLACGVAGALTFIYTPRLMDMYACLGASGACFGIIAAACSLVDEHKMFRVLALLVLCMFIFPQYCATVVGFILPSGVASAAHLGGAMMGLVLAHHLKLKK